MELTPSGIAKIICGAVWEFEGTAGSGSAARYDAMTGRAQRELAEAVAQASGPADIAPILDMITLTPTLPIQECRLIAAILDALSPGDMPRFVNAVYEQLSADAQAQYQQQRKALAAMAHYVVQAEDAGADPGAPHEWVFPAGVDFGRASVLTREPGQLIVHWTPPGAETASSEDLIAHARQYIGVTRETVAGDPALSSLISFGTPATDASNAPGVTLNFSGNWTPKATEDFKRRWDELQLAGLPRSGRGGWIELPAPIIERKPQVGDRVHYAAQSVPDRGTACTAATITGLGETEVKDAVGTVQEQVADLFVMTSSGVFHATATRRDPGTYSAGERTAAPGEPLPVITCDDLTFAPGTWHWGLMSEQPAVSPEPVDSRYVIHMAALVDDGSTIKDTGDFYEASLAALAGQDINPGLFEAWIERNRPDLGHELGGPARLDEQCITIWQTRRTDPAAESPPEPQPLA